MSERDSQELRKDRYPDNNFLPEVRKANLIIRFHPKLTSTKKSKKLLRFG